MHDAVATRHMDVPSEGKWRTLSVAWKASD